MRLDVDAPLSAEWLSGRTALVTGGGGRESGVGGGPPRAPYPGVKREPARAGAGS
jgi:hypothetical protein